jgi:hypothetical protein
LRFLIRRLVPSSDPQSPLKQGNCSPTTPLPSPASDFTMKEYSENRDRVPGLANEDFEYLYYMILCKIQELYRDLQVRFACGFVDMDHILHTRTHTGLCVDHEEAFTVRDMRNFILAVWHLYHDRTFLFILDNAVKDRKQAILNGIPLETGSSHAKENDRALAVRNIPLSSTLRSRLDSPDDKSSSHPSSPLKTMDDRSSIIRKTIRGVISESNPAVLMDMFNRKYGKGEYASLSSNLLNDFSTMRTDVLADVFVSPHPRKSVLERMVEKARFNEKGRIVSALPCVCDKYCDCKITCDVCPGVCVCVFRRSPLGPSPNRISPEHPDYVLLSPIRITDSTVTLVPSPLFSRRPQYALQQPPTNSQYDSVLSSRAYTSNQATITPVKISPSHPPSQKASNSAEKQRLNRVRMSNVSKPLPKPPEFGPDIHDLRLQSPSPLDKLGNKKGIMKALRLRDGLIRTATESDVSYRVPFEQDKHFQSSPLLVSIPQRRRFVSAGGNLPLSDRESVKSPFSPVRTNKSPQKDALGKAIAQLSSRASVVSPATKNTSPSKRQGAVGNVEKEKKSRLSGILGITRNQ